MSGVDSCCIGLTDSSVNHCCRADGYETIMMNSNPETVSTDYDTSSRLYFEPLTIEDVLNVIEKERPEGIIIQFGGQTPLKLANAIQKSLEDNPLPAASGMPPPTIARLNLCVCQHVLVCDVFVQSPRTDDTPE